MTIYAEEGAVDLSEWVVVGDILVDEGKVAGGGGAGPCQVLLADDTGQEGAGGGRPQPPAPAGAAPAAEPKEPEVVAPEPSQRQAEEEVAGRELAGDGEAAPQELMEKLPPPAVPELQACGAPVAQDPDAELLEWACAGVSGKRLRSLRSFRELADDLADGRLTESLSPEDWCMNLVADINDLVEGHSGREWEEVCNARLTGGDGEGALCTLADAALARRKGISNGLARVLRERGESRRPLLQAVAAEYLRRYVHRVSEQLGELRPPRPARRVSVTFDTRPFGIMPFRGDKGDATVGYIVDKVNHNDPSKPAARLGVRPGWVAVRLDNTDVHEMPLGQIQNLLKEALLPITFEFEVPPKSMQARGLGAPSGGRKSQDGSPATSMSPPASPPCNPQLAPSREGSPAAGPASVPASPPSQPLPAPQEDEGCQGGWDDPEW